MPGEVIPQTGAELQGPVYSIFVPALQLIQFVDNNVTATVTTIEPHGYNTGMVVRVNVPPIYGMNILEQTTIFVDSPTTFITQIDTTGQNLFVAPTPYPPNAWTPAQVIPMTGQEANIATPEV